ncbi:MAG TPA: HAD family hydrolase [Miltoncostaeaceae bacterium]|nr:HAD family hydrolase [Miltoncostaeaceae bacterium]
MAAVPILTWVLALLDIDGTLLMGRPHAHTEALATAAAEVFAVPATEDDIAAIGPAGRTDREIGRLVLRRHDVPDDRITAGLPEWMTRACELYPSLEPLHPPPVVAPGAAAGLEALRGDGVTLALLTGNLEPIAHAKMAAASLGEWFPRGRGAFGSDHDRRDALVPVAVARDGGDRDVVVIGDTPRDIACAVAGGARCVAVTTGVHGPDDLAAADAVVDGLPAAAAVIRGWRAPRGGGAGAASRRPPGRA